MLWRAAPAWAPAAGSSTCAPAWGGQPGFCRGAAGRGSWRSSSTRDEPRALLGHAGFSAIDAEDLSEEWRPILRRRLEMYRALRGDTIARLGEQRYQEYDQLYTFFVGLVEDGKVGGGRFSATG